jgi:hypothetical protein
VLEFAGEVGLEGIDEDEFLAAATFMVEPAPFELAFVAQVVDFLDAAGDEFGSLGNANPGGGTLETKADFAIDRRRQHLDEPLLANGGRRGPRKVRVWRRLVGAAHRGPCGGSDVEAVGFGSLRGLRRRWLAISKNGVCDLKEVVHAVTGPFA